VLGAAADSARLAGARLAVTIAASTATAAASCCSSFFSGSRTMPMALEVSSIPLRAHFCAEGSAALPALVALLVARWGLNSLPCEGQQQSTKGVVASELCMRSVALQPSCPALQLVYSPRRQR
jgi:hypothetical protein